MNIQTIKYISSVAGFAKDQMNSGKSLKWATAYVAECLDESTTPIDETDGVDFTAAKLALQYLVNENRKERFAFNASGIVTNMIKLRESL